MTRHADENYDPFAEVESKAKKAVIEEQAAKNMSTARAKLVLGKDAAHIFFATLALKLEPKVNWDIETVASDGKYLFYNPDYFTIMLLDEAKGVLSATVLKLALAHHARKYMGIKDPMKWEIASKMAVHPIVIESGLKLPTKALMPGKKPDPELHLPDDICKAIEKMQPGLSAEEYYDQLPTGPGNPSGGGGKGSGGKGKGKDNPDQQPNDDVDGCGGMQTPGDGSEASNNQSAAEWGVNAAQARQTAKLRGTLPGGIDRLVEDLLAPKVDWTHVLREFVSCYAKNDYAWNPPNKRYIHQNIYLPGLRSEELGDVLLFVDTSGSISIPELTRFASEAQGILEAFDCELTIVYHDAAIAHVQTWRSSDGPLVLEPKGGGGTDHHPCFQWLKESELQPACVVCLTDLYTSIPETGPDVPVLWCVIHNPSPKVPWGTLLQVDL